jgi:pyruvate-ferredoxin/flavodoxin oxidoreductase
MEGRNSALEIAVRDQELCIQCGNCVPVCPHGVLRAKLFDEQYLDGAPPTVKAVPARSKDLKDKSTACRSRPRIVPAVRCKSSAARKEQERQT